MRFVAFLRGINVGGNVIFESTLKDSRKAAQKIEATLEKRYKRAIRAIVRPMHDIEMLAKADPFKGIPVTKETRLYVTFLDKKPAKHLKTTGEFFRVVKTCPFAVCSVLILTPDRGTLDLMDSLGKHYGKDVTTRNWNTVQKILKAAI